MSRSVVAVLGSPRREGNSATLARQAACGARARGASVDTFYLHGMAISPCTGCDACRSSAASECVIEDRMSELYSKLRRADALILASPVHWWTVSAQTKLFLDRCYALGGPEGNALAGKDVVIILTHEGADPITSGAVNALHTLYDGFKYVGSHIVDVIQARAGRGDEAVSENGALMRRAYEAGECLG